MELIISFLLLLCTLIPPPLEGAAISVESTPSLPESSTVHAQSNTTMNTIVVQSSSAEPSQETRSFTVITDTEANTVAFAGMQGSDTDGTPRDQTLKSMNLTTPQPGPPTAIQTELQTQAPNTQEPNSTSEITKNTNQTMSEVDTTQSPPSANVTHSGSKNNTLMTTTEAPIPPKVTFTPIQLSTSLTSSNPEPAASTLGHTSTTVKILETSTSMKTTTRKTAPPIKPKTTPADNEPSEMHGIAAAVIISLILLMMFVGIIFIMVKKRKWQRRQLENSDWAGPSPFLDGSSQPHFSRNSTKDESKRISFAGFLPQSLSKRHSLLNDTDEGLAMDMVPGTTFGQTNTVESKPQNGTAHEDKAQDIKILQDHQNTSESVPVTTAVADHQPKSEATDIKEDNVETNPQQTPTLQPSTSSTDIVVPPQPPTAPSSDIPAPPPLPATSSSDIPAPPPLTMTDSTDIPLAQITTSTDSSSPPAIDIDVQSSNDTSASEVPIPPAPPLT